jgi:hypothetical protein
MKTQKIYTSLDTYKNHEDLINKIIFTDKNLCEQVTEMFNKFNDELMQVLKQNIEHVGLLNSTLSYPSGKQTHSYVLREDKQNKVLDTLEYVHNKATCKEHDAFVFSDYADEYSHHKSITVDFGGGVATSNMAIQNYLESKGK